MKFVALIPARGGSKRIPRKNLQRVGGVTLVERAIQCAKSCYLISETFVSTEDSEIMEVSARADATVIVRPDELAADNTRMEDVVAHFLSVIPLQDDDVVILLEPSAPLRTFWDILHIAAITQDKNVGAARIVSAHTDNCHGFVYFDTGLASAIKVRPFKYDSRCLFPEATRLLHMGDDRAIDVDTPADLERARALA